MNTNAGAISSGCAARPMGVCAPNCATALASLSAGFSGVRTGPGAIALTHPPADRTIRTAIAEYKLAGAASPYSHLSIAIDYGQA